MVGILQSRVRGGTDKRWGKDGTGSYLLSLAHKMASSPTRPRKMTFDPLLGLRDQRLALWKLYQIPRREERSLR